MTQYCVDIVSHISAHMNMTQNSVGIVSLVSALSSVINTARTDRPDQKLNDTILCRYCVKTRIPPPQKIIVV